MNTPLVSAIVPVYNVAPYLEQCLNSIVNQTYRNLEIILVDDGSTDESGAICDRYAEQDSRIRVVHQKNKGLSGARNSGLDIASGEYIIFIDSDDYIWEGTVEGYISLFSQHADLDMIESNLYFSSYRSTPPPGEDYDDEASRSGILTAKEVWKYFALKGYGPTAIPHVGNKCYRRSFIGEYRFKEGHVWEDIEFHLRLFGRIRHYLKWNKVTFYYRENRPGAITEPNYKKLIPSYEGHYENMKQIILDLEETKKRGIQSDYGLISIDEHINYVASRFMTDLLYPPYGDMADFRIRRLYSSFQEPYIKFLRHYPYASIHPYRVWERNIAVWSYSFYMKIYLPIVFQYKYIRSRFLKR